MSLWRCSSARTPSRTKRLSSAKNTLIVSSLTRPPSAPAAGCCLLERACLCDRPPFAHAIGADVPVARRHRQGGGSLPPSTPVAALVGRAFRRQDDGMRYEAQVTALSWIPSEAVSGSMRVPFDVGVAHYDEPPPEQLGDG